MNPQHLLIDNACRIAVLDKEHNKFTEAQEKELIELLNVFRDLKGLNKLNLTNALKTFEDQYVAFEGNHELLEAEVRKVIDNQAVQAAKAAGLKIVKR